MKEPLRGTWLFGDAISRYGDWFLLISSLWHVNSSFASFEVIIGMYLLNSWLPVDVCEQICVECFTVSKIDALSWQLCQCHMLSYVFSWLCAWGSCAIICCRFQICISRKKLGCVSFITVQSYDTCPDGRIRFFAHYTTSLSSLCRHIRRYWMSKILVRYVPSTMCIRLSQFSQLPFMQYMVCVFGVPIPYDECENKRTLSWYHNQIECMTHLPLVRVRSCMSLYIHMLVYDKCPCIFSILTWK